MSNVRRRAASKSIKNGMMVAAAGVMCGFVCASAMTASAAETGSAYVFIRDVATEGVRFEGIGSSVNTIKEGVTTAEITADGSYAVSFDLSKESAFETVDEISKLQLYVVGTDKTADVKITVDALKINGAAVTLTGTPEVQKADNTFYADLSDANGESLFNRTDYVKNITSVEIDFTVSGWPVEETTTAETTTEAPAETTTTAATTTTAPATTTTAAPATTVKTEGNTTTGDASGIGAVMAVLAGAAVLSAVTLRKKD